MKRTLIIVIALFFISVQILAQKGKDDGGSDEKKENNPPVNPDDGGGQNGDNACMNTAMEITSILFGTYQSSLLSSSKNPTTTSFEVLLHGGMVTGNDVSNFALYPRVRLNYGAISGDIRYSYIDQGESDPLSILDAIADFNVVIGKSFKLSIGQGIMYNLNLTEDNIFHESYLGMDIGIMDRSILISPEFRLAYDWSVKSPVNSELSLRAGYRIFNNSSFAIYVNAAGAYQYAGDGISNTLLYGGLDIFI